MMLLEAVIQELESCFPSLNFAVNKEEYVITIPPIHEGFGNIEIADDLDELIVTVGNFTHWHVGCYEEAFSEQERAEAIAEDVIDFLQGLFNDQFVMWGSHQAGGGFIARNKLQSEQDLLKAYQKWLWSGPIPDH
jgi:hypothetical protein